MRIHSPSTWLCYIPAGQRCPCALLQPSPKFKNLRSDGLAQQGAPAPINVHVMPLVDSAYLHGGAGGGNCCSPHWRGGEEALLCFPTAHGASLVSQTHTCIKGGGGEEAATCDFSRPSAASTPGKTPWRFGGACFGLIFIYPSQRK